MTSAAMDDGDEEFIKEALGALPPQEQFHDRLAVANRLQASKVNALMKSIKVLEKENHKLRHRSMEHRRTSEFRHIQVELGQQDGMIAALRRLIGDEKATELVRDAASQAPLKGSAEGRALPQSWACCDCGETPEELHPAEDGALFCRPCFTRRFWTAPSQASRPSVARSSVGSHARTREELLDDLDRAKKELGAAKCSLQSAKKEEECAAKAAADLPFGGALSHLASTASRLTSFVSGNNQRAEQLAQVNASLEDQRASLEQAVAQQEEHAQKLRRENVAKPPVQALLEAEQEELEGKMRLKEGEISRVEEVVEQLESQHEQKQRSLEPLSRERENAVRELKNTRQHSKEAKARVEAEYAERLRAEKDKGSELLEQLEKRRATLQETKQHCQVERGRLREQAEASEQEADVRAQDAEYALATKAEATQRATRERLGPVLRKSLAEVERAEEECERDLADQEAAHEGAAAARKEAAELEVETSQARGALAEAREQEAEASKRCHAEAEQTKKSERQLAEEEPGLRTELAAAQQALAALHGASAACGPGRAPQADAKREPEALSKAEAEATDITRKSCDDLRVLMKQVMDEAAGALRVEQGELATLREKVELYKEEASRAAELSEADRTAAASQAGITAEVPPAPWPPPPGPGLLPLPPKLLLSSGGRLPDAAAEGGAPQAASVHAPDRGQREPALPQPQAPGIRLRMTGDDPGEEEVQRLRGQLAGWKASLREVKDLCASAVAGSAQRDCQPTPSTRAIGGAAKASKHSDYDRVAQLQEYHLRLEQDVQQLQRQISAARLLLGGNRALRL